MQRKLQLFPLALVALLLVFTTDASAQRRKKKKKNKDNIEKLEPWQVDTLITPIPISRQLFTGKVEQQIRKADIKDGSVDGKIEIEDTAVSRIATQAMLIDAPRLLIHIENLPTSDHQAKLQMHRALEKVLVRLNGKNLTPDNATYMKRAIANFEELVIAREQKRVMEYVKDNANIYTLDNSDLLNDFPQAKAYVFETVGKAKPELMIKRLPEFARESYADPIIAAAAKIVPGTILTYATSTSALSSAVRRNKDPLVQTIVRIGTESRTPLKALPFLNEIHNKRKTIAQVDAITKNPKQYYKALVALKVSNDMVNAKSVDQELNLRGLEMVREVNRLHDSPAPVRFKSLLDFNAEELYYMMIGSQDEIYTSSFTWMFDRMLEKMAPEKGNELLNKVHKDHFRTFIRMAAGYNKLSPFLKSMDEDKKSDLMREFVANLERGDEDELEDAVDVADAFGSITDTKLIDFLKDEIKQNYERVYKANNQESEKGLIVYGLLSTIFNSADNAGELSGKLSVIPPITYVPNQSLRNEKGEIIIQTFFYGDEDGKSSFASFKSNFPANKWKSVTNKNWVTFTSTGANPIIVYANLPLNEPKDEEAQRALAIHLAEKEIEPTMVIHRGHSYHLGGSLANLTPEVKVVMLGSCGGYHNLANVLDKSPDANIISSKQIGAMAVNEPIIKQMLSQLMEGKDIDWLATWSNLNKYFASRGAHERDLFSDYIPPNRNLGAIFIKAYRKMALQNEE